MKGVPHGGWSGPRINEIAISEATRRLPVSATRQSLAIAADAQFSVDRPVLGRPHAEVVLILRRYILGRGLPMADRRLSDVRRLPDAGTCLPCGLRTAAGTLLTRIVLGEGSTAAQGQGCDYGISHCDSTHGHYPFLFC